MLSFKSHEDVSVYPIHWSEKQVQIFIEELKNSLEKKLWPDMLSMGSVVFEAPLEHKTDNFSTIIIDCREHKKGFCDQVLTDIEKGDRIFFLLYRENKEEPFIHLSTNITDHLLQLLFLTSPVLLTLIPDIFKKQIPIEDWQKILSSFTKEGGIPYQQALSGINMMWLSLFMDAPRQDDCTEEKLQSIMEKSGVAVVSPELATILKQCIDKPTHPFAQYYVEKYEIPRLFTRKEFASITTKLNSMPHPVIIDIGSAGGGNLMALKALFPHAAILGIEPVEYSLDNALRCLPEPSQTRISEIIKTIPSDILKKTQVMTIEESKCCLTLSTEEICFLKTLSKSSSDCFPVCVTCLEDLSGKLNRKANLVTVFNIQIRDNLAAFCRKLAKLVRLDGFVLVGVHYGDNKQMTAKFLKHLERNFKNITTIECITYSQNFYLLKDPRRKPLKESVQLLESEEKIRCKVREMIRKTREKSDRKGEKSLQNDQTLNDFLQLFPDVQQESQVILHSDFRLKSDVPFKLHAANAEGKLCACEVKH